MPAALAHTAPIAEEHHQRLLGHIDRMPALAELIDTDPLGEFREALRETCTFMTDQLLPHMEAAERAFYGELERMMQNRHSTKPLRREHAEIRAGIAELDRVHSLLECGQLPMAEQISLRRTVFRLYGLLKVHLAEERLYADIVEHGASAEARQALATAMEHAGTTLD